MPKIVKSPWIICRIHKKSTR